MTEAKFRLGQKVATPDGVGMFQYRIMIKGLITNMVSFPPGTPMDRPYANDTVWVLKDYADEQLERVP